MFQNMFSVLNGDATIRILILDQRRKKERAAIEASGEIRKQQSIICCFVVHLGNRREDVLHYTMVVKLGDIRSIRNFRLQEVGVPHSSRELWSRSNRRCP